MPAHHPESAGACAARNAPSIPRYVLRDPHMACEKAPTHVGLVPPNLITMHAKRPPSTPYRCCDLLSLSQTPARYQSRSIHHLLSAHSRCDVTEGKGCAVSNAAHTTIKPDFVPKAASNCSLVASPSVYRSTRHARRHDPHSTRYATISVPPMGSAYCGVFPNRVCIPINNVHKTRQLHHRAAANNLRPRKRLVVGINPISYP